MDRLNPVHRVTEAVALGRPLNEVYEAALDAVGAPRAAVLLYDKEGVLRFTATRGLSERYQRAVEGHTPWSAGSRKPPPLLIEDLEAATGLDDLIGAIRAEGIAAMAFVPVAHSDAVIGKMMLYYDSPHTFSPEEITAAETVASLIALVAHHRREQALARTRDETLKRSEEKLEFLSRAGSQILGASLDFEELMETLVGLAVPALGDWGAVRIREDGTTRRVAVRHADPAKEDLARRLLAYPTAGTAIDEVISSGKSMLIEEVTDQMLVDGAVDEAHLQLLREIKIRSAMIVPLKARGKVLGAVSLATAESGRTFGQVDLLLVEDLAARAGLALNNAALYETEREARSSLEAARKDLRFLLETSTLLSSSLNYSQVLDRLARVAVGDMADLCLIDMFDAAGRVVRMAAAHADPQKQPMADLLLQRYAPDPEGPHPAISAMRTGQPLFAPEISEEFLRATARDEEHFRLCRDELGLLSYICVPLVARGNILGTLTLVMTRSSGRRYDSSSVDLAQGLASRAALSIDNARLYAEARDIQEKLAFLSEASESLFSSLNYRKTLDKIATVPVGPLGEWSIAWSVDPQGGDLLAAGHAAMGSPEALAAAVAGPPAGKGVLLALRAALDGSRPVVSEGLPQVLCDALSAADGLDWAALTAGSVTATIPLRARGRFIGAAVVGRLNGAPPYLDDDILIVEEFGRRAALSLDNARVYLERSHIARTLQRSLLPPKVPEIAGVEIVTYYRPGGEGIEVGGDFFDVYETAEGDWAILIGDVCGKGVGAAALTALARHTLRAAAIRDRDPERVLALLNEAVSRDSSGDFCTVAYVRLQMHEGTAVATVASGGHPAPVHVRAKGGAGLVPVRGALLGVVADPEIAAHRLELEAGDVLVFYTDGLIEGRRTAAGFDQDKLVGLLSECAGLKASAIAAEIEKAVPISEEPAMQDDIAFMVVRLG